MKTKLRVAVVLPERTIPLWAAQMLARIQSSDAAEVTALLLVSGEVSSVDRLTKRLYRAHFALDQRVFRPPSPHPWGTDDVGNILPKVCVFEGLTGENIAHLKSMKVDVLLNLGLRDYPETMPGCARYGAWTLRDAENRFVIGAEVGWRELIYRAPFLVCALEVERRGHAKQIVAEATMAANTFSFTWNQESILWKAVVLVLRALLQLHRYGEKDLFAKAKTVGPPRKAPPLPSLRQMITLGSRQIADIYSEKIWRRMFPHPWALMARFGSEAEPLDWAGLKPIVPPRGAFWADPFVVKREGQTYIFLEEYLYKTKRGHIACMRIGEEGRLGRSQTVLERPYHLSYPFIFDFRGETYMIPETAQNRTIEVYRCKRFPDQWSFEKTLMRDVHAVDTTMIQHAGCWWMFVNMREEGGSTYDELFLFYADDPLAERWTSHPRNPIVTDVRSARPAGRLFHRDGRLIRPSQDSSHRYGHAINLNHVLTLTKTRYEENLIDRLEPRDENMLAVHTFNFVDDVTVVDVLLRR